MIQLKKTFDTEGFFRHLQFSCDSNNSLLETILDYCEKNDIDVQTAAEIVKKNTKFKKQLLQEAQQLHLIK